MDKEAFEGLKRWHDDTVSGLLDEAIKEPCNFCKMSPCFVDEVYDRVFLEVGGELEELGMSNNEIRFGMYRDASRLWTGRVGTGIRYKLPYCVLSNIRDAYPELNGAYVGFKKGSKGGDEEEPEEDPVLKARLETEVAVATGMFVDISGDSSPEDKKPAVEAVAKLEDNADKKRPPETPEKKPAAKKKPSVMEPHGLPNSMNPYGLDYYADIKEQFPNHAFFAGNESDTTAECEWKEEEDPADPPIQLILKKDSDSDDDEENKKQPPPFMPLTQEPMRITMKMPMAN